MSIIDSVEFRVPLIGSECLTRRSIKVLDRYSRERYIPIETFSNRRNLDGVKRTWENTPFKDKIEETVFDISVCEYGYTVTRTDFLKNNKLSIFIRLYIDKQMAINMFMEITGETYDGE